jgi:hypothetical protein
MMEMLYGSHDVQDLALAHLVPSGATKYATGRHREAVHLFAVGHRDADFTAAVHDDFLVLAVDRGTDVVELQRTGVRHLHVAAFHLPARGAADVEGTHRELGARLADGLRRDDADRLADVDEVAGGQVAAVATLRKRRAWTGR